MSEAFGLEVVKVETLSPPDSNAINELMTQSQQQPPPTPQMQHQVERASNAEQFFSDSNMSGDNMQITYNFSTRKRGLSWSDMETRTLLEVWTERNNLFEVDDLCSANGQIYRTIATEMTERGYQKTAIQCKTRMKTLKRAYKHCRMLLRTRGKVKKLCRFYKEIDYIVRHTSSKKKLAAKSGPNLDPGVVSADGKQAANESWESSKSGGTDGEKYDQLSIPLMECEVIENELSDEIEISDDSDDDFDEEEENMSASTPEMKTSQSVVPVSSVSIPSESKPVETKLEAFSLNPVESKWMNVISLDDSANTSNANPLSSSRNLLMELGEMARSNPQNQVTNTRAPFSFPETVFLPEKDPISHLNGGAKQFSNKQTVNQLDLTSDQPLEPLSEPLAKELWATQGVRNILQKQGINQFAQQNENRISISNTFQTNRQHFQPSLDIIQINQPILDKSLDSRSLTSSSSYANAIAPPPPPPPLMPMEVLVPGNESRSDTDDLRKRRQTAELNHFEQTLKSVVDSFTNSLERIQNKQLQTETFRLDLEMKKLEVERERQVLEREKMKNEIQRHREDREHQFAMLKMILEHVSSPRPSLGSDSIGLDSSTSQLLNSINPKT